MAGDTIELARRFFNGVCTSWWYRGWLFAVLCGLGTFFGFIYKGLIGLEEDADSARLDDWEKIPRVASAIVFGYVIYGFMLHLVVGMVCKRPRTDKFGAPLTSSVGTQSDL